MKTIKRIKDQQEAKIIISYLRANGIDAEILDGAINSVLPVMPGGVRIAVPEHQESEAIGLLELAQSGGAAISDGDER